MSRAQRLLVIGIVALHTVLLAWYTLPEGCVPGSLRVLATAYARPLFHQQWRLFAPDPPLCSADVLVKEGDLLRPLHAGDAGQLTERMANTVARLVQVEVAQGDTAPRPELARAMYALASDRARELGELHFVLVEHCVVDPENPAKRVERITPLLTPR